MTSITIENLMSSRPVGQKSAMTFMIMSCLCSAMIGVFCAFASHGEPDISAGAISFVRVILHPLIALIPLWTFYDKHHENRFDSADDSLSTKVWLFIWGISGAATVLMYFYAITKIGAGMANVFAACSGLGLVLVGPIFNLGRWSAFMVAAAGLAMLGTALIKAPSNSAVSSIEMITCGGSLAFVSTLAWLAAAKLAQEVSVRKLAMVWTAFGLISHLLWFTQTEIHWPHGLSWLYVIAAGASTALAQVLAALSFKLGDVLKLSVAGYSAPILSVFIDYLFFDLKLPTESIFGIALIIAGCVIASTLRKGKT